MIVGFNHNITYRGAVFHVQTEDSGPKNPHLVTLLYHDGTIISSQKTVYADILKVDNLDQVVEELAKEQHKGMLRRLTHGEFDDRIAALGIALVGKAEAAAETNEQPDMVVKSSVPVATPDTETAEPEPVKIVEEPIIDKFRKPRTEEMGLEDLIYAYLTAGQKQS